MIRKFPEVFGKYFAILFKFLSAHLIEYNSDKGKKYIYYKNNMYIVLLIEEFFNTRKSNPFLKDGTSSLSACAEKEEASPV